MVISTKPNGKRILALVAAAAVLVAAFVFMPSSRGSETEGLKTDASTADQRVDFLAQFGWEVDPEPLEIREIEIPQTFDKVYERYNQLQKEQGMDLLPYAGKTCKQWIYHITNFPDSGQQVRAVLLVYDGKVIGGDISSVALDGFMTGFEGEGWQEETAVQPVEEAEPEQPEEIPSDAWPVD